MVRFCLLLMLGIFNLPPIVPANAIVSPDKIWDKNGRYIVPWEEMPVEHKTLALEKYLQEIEYSLAHVGKSFVDIDSRRVNSKAYELEVGYITYGLIGSKYCRYGDYKKCAEYDFKNYQQAKKCAREASPTKPTCWGGALGDGYHLLAPVVADFELNNDYKGALPYYRIWLNDLVGNLKGENLEEKLENLKIRTENNERKQNVMEIVLRWENAKKLAKTSKPKPLDPVVQHHEWFYSDKPEEVLKALEYYHKYKVRFMVEKAAKDKRPSVAKKAKEYLGNWDKPETGVIGSTVPETGTK